jgi:hypothetical protein
MKKKFCESIQARVAKMFPDLAGPHVITDVVTTVPQSHLAPLCRIGSTCI